jgi:glyoxylase-like metal-dependent hydrolase (beta-lactamase superfamily II)
MAGSPDDERPGDAIMATRIGSVDVEAVLSPSFAQFCYLAWPAGSETETEKGEAVVIDPGFEAQAVINALREAGRTAVAILNTHGHSDHIAGNRALKAAFPDAPIVIGRDEAHMLLDPVANLSSAFGSGLTSPPADRLVDEGEVITYAGLRFEVRAVPGHSAGSVVFIARDSDPVVVFGGDVLFAGSIGRTDFPGGSFEVLEAGIRAKLYTLPDTAVVLPGHGPPTTVGRERRSNPFVGDRV